MIYFINGLQWSGYKRFDWSIVDSWGRARKTREPSLSIPCFAERRYGGVLDDEMLMALPPEQLGKAIAGMEALARNGLRYPFPQYGIQQDVRAGLASSPCRDRSPTSPIRTTPGVYDLQLAALAGPRHCCTTIVRHHNRVFCLMALIDLSNASAKLLHAFSFQSRGNIGKADIETIEALHSFASLRHLLLDRTGDDVAVVEHRSDRLFRHRADRHRPDQRLDIHQIRIIRDFRAGARRNRRWARTPCERRASQRGAASIRFKL